MKFKLFILSIVILLGLFLRVYKLDTVPPGLTWDEAALGYNAYSISQTLKDEYGTFLPLTLKSFGDYKPALYAYLIIPFMLVFGLNEIAVRLPSVLAGVGLIIVIFLLVKHIFKDYWLSLSAAFFTAISPISIQFSRAGWESNVAVFLNATGLYLFLKGLQKPKYFILASILFSLSLFCYQASKIFIPIILVGIFLFFRKQIKYSKSFLISFIILISGLVLMFSSTFLLGQSDRLAAQNYFAYARPAERLEIISKEDGFEISGVKFQFLHGEWWSFLSGALERYITYFSPDILFIEGDYSPRHSIPDLGILNLYGLILLPFGIYLLWRKKEPERKIILFWLFTATLPAVLSRDLISMVRALNIVLPLVIIEGFGFYFLITKLSSLLNVKKFIVTAALAILVSLNIALFIDFYFVHSSNENSEDWMYGYKQVIEKLPDLSKYDKVIFTHQYGQPYIYHLFYTKYPPEKFQAQAKLEQESVDVGTVRKVDNIEYRQIHWSEDRGLENTLLVGTNEEIPEGDIVTEKKSKKLLEINFLNDKLAFKVIENGYDEEN